MPRYRFRCASCGMDWEETRSIEERVADCIECGAECSPRVQVVNLSGDRKTEGKSSERMSDSS